MSKEVHLRLRNISPADFEKLKLTALEKTGSPSIAGLIRYLVLQLLDNTPHESTEFSQTRTEVRLNQKTKEKLELLAKEEKMTVNRFIRLLLHNYTNEQKAMSANQIQVLRESNYQLYQIGKNINQIAKAINQGTAVSITTQELQKLQKLIDTHTNKVGDVIATTPTL